MEQYYFISPISLKSEVCKTILLVLINLSLVIPSLVGTSKKIDGFQFNITLEKLLVFKKANTCMRYKKMSIWLISIFSILLNIILLRKTYEHHIYSIDLRYVSVIISGDPSDAIGMEGLLSEGEKVILITDESNDNCSITMLYEDQKLESMWWHTRINKFPSRSTLAQEKFDGKLGQQ